MIFQIHNLTFKVDSNVTIRFNLNFLSFFFFFFPAWTAMLLLGSSIWIWEDQENIGLCATTWHLTFFLRKDEDILQPGCKVLWNMGELCINGTFTLASKSLFFKTLRRLDMTCNFARSVTRVSTLEHEHWEHCLCTQSLLKIRFSNNSHGFFL